MCARWLQQVKEDDAREWQYPRNRLFVDSVSDMQSDAVICFSLATRRRDDIQPRCDISLCMEACPYAGGGMREDVIDLENGDTAVVLMRRMDDGEGWTGCAVMYVRGVADKEDVEGHGWEYAKRHVPRLMESCPLKMEHRLKEWSRQKRNDKAEE